MKETLTILIKSLVYNPESVTINEISKADNIILYEVIVSEKDIGRIIGREGKMAKAIRTVIKSIATKNNLKVTIEFIGK